MMRKNFFSIIIPCRSINSYLVDETLPAIDKQSFKHFEVIILPDYLYGFNLLQKKYSWLRVIHNKSMPGIKRDIGVQKSKGNIVVFIDDDAYPPKNWLSTLDKIYSRKEDIVATGGPGILPEKVNIWEKIFDTVMQSFIGAGGFSYRFIKGKKQFVDDFPSMNLSMRKKTFVKLGGFKNKYWPGEDSKLINALITNEKKLIYYDPQSYIYHHRRNNLIGYLRQHRNYGYMRGMFMAHKDKNSQSIIYKIPSLFVLYLYFLSVLYIARIWLPVIIPFADILLIPLVVYVIMILFIGFLTLFKTRNIRISLGTMFVLPLTHLIYGLSFMKGYMTGKQA